MANIVFIGLGHMGLHMATNLVKHKHTVYGYDLNSNAVSTFKHRGGQVLADLTNFAEQPNFVISMLPSGKQVWDILLDKPGLLNILPKKTFFIDCSSIDVSDAQKIHAVTEQRKIHWIDAPVSGGVAGAEAGTLTFMVGANDIEFKKAKPILACMGKKIIHTGPVTSGQIAKICNNMILGVSMIAVSEAFVLAQKLGLTPQKLHEVVSQSSGQCWTMDKYVPVPNVLKNVPADNKYQAGFTAAMMLKDLNSSQHAAQLAGIITQMGAKATEIYQKVVSENKGQLDFSVVIKSV